jgi:hypothetical protein
LIVDPDVCKYSGGVYTNACWFYYRYNQLINFKPIPPVTSQTSCDPPVKSVVDPKGAVKASYPTNGAFTTGGTTTTCVVQVYVGK